VQGWRPERRRLGSLAKRGLIATTEDVQRPWELTRDGAAALKAAEALGKNDQEGA